MKLFGTFLLEQRLITEDQLLAALVAQVEAVPSVAKIVFDRGLLSKSDQLKVMSHQALNRCEFVAACRALGMWGESLEAAIIEAVARSREPIGATLVRNQVISQQQLDDQLSAFLESHSHQLESVARAQVVSTPPVAEVAIVAADVAKVEAIPSEPQEAPMEDLDAVSSAPSFQFEPKFGKSAPAAMLLNEFFSVFNAERFESLQSKLKNSVVGKPTSAQISDVIEEVAIIGASVRFLRLPLMSRVCDEVELFIGEMGVVEMWSNEVVNLVSEAISVMWSIRLELSSDRDEEQMWQDAEFREIFTRCVSGMSSYLNLKKAS